MKVSIIAAVAQNRAIGRDNDLIWDLPDDMAFFQSSTKGHHIITGRLNYESIPEKYRPLPHRTNMVVTRNSNYHAPGAHVVSCVREGLDIARANGETNAFIIGGGQIYAKALAKDFVDELLITHVHDEFEADVYFPEVNWADWQRSEALYHPKDAKHTHDFTITRYLRVREDG